MVTPVELISVINEFTSHPSTLYARNEDFGYTQPFQLKPEDFLQYARDDQRSNLRHKNINALSNAKRAIDCQVETILKVYGYLEFAKRSQAFKTFPGKQIVLAKIGITSRAIVTRQNAARNVMEHEFADPSPEQAEEAIEVAKLYVHATQNYLRDFTPYFEMDNEVLQEKICFHFDSTEKKLYIRIHRLEYDSVTDYKNNYQGVIVHPGFNTLTY